MVDEVDVEFGISGHDRCRRQWTDVAKIQVGPGIFKV